MAFAFAGYELDEKEILRARDKFFKKMRIAAKEAVGLWIQHKNDVVVVGSNSAGCGMINKDTAVKADGLITNTKGLLIFMVVADCMPVILYDKQKDVVGLVHIGWRNADSNTVGVAVNKLKSKFGSANSNIIVGIGPAVRKDSFIKQNPSQKDDPKWKPFLEKISDDLYKIDVVGLCKKELVDVGVLAKNIFDCGIDTAQDVRFFSHVRDKDLPKRNQGRFACVVGML